MNFDQYGNPIFPGERGYSSCCGDVDRYGKGVAEMSDPFRNYDAWKLASPDDEAEEAEWKRKLAEAKENQADSEYDRKKDGE